MNLSKVLYVIPVYNAEAWLDDCIQSIIDQDFEEIQILCIDDGSTDNSVTVLDKYTGSLPNFSYLVQENAGPGAAFNRGLRFAVEKGFQFIARMDADDICMPCRTGKQVAVLKEKPAVAACSSSAEYFMDEGLPLGESLVPCSSEDIRKEIIAGGRGLIQGATLFRTSALESIGGYRANKTPAEDTDIFLRLAERYPLSNIPEIAYKIRVCGDSHSLGDVYLTRLYHHFYLHLAALRKKGLAEIDFDDYVKALSVFGRLSVKREAASMQAYFNWMTSRSKPALLYAALLDPQRTVRRVIKKLTGN